MNWMKISLVSQIKILNPAKKWTSKCLSPQNFKVLLLLKLVSLPHQRFARNPCSYRWKNEGGGGGGGLGDFRQHEVHTYFHESQSSGSKCAMKSSREIRNADTGHSSDILETVCGSVRILFHCRLDGSPEKLHCIQSPWRFHILY